MDSSLNAGITQLIFIYFTPLKLKNKNFPILYLRDEIYKNTKLMIPSSIPTGLTTNPALDTSSVYFLD